jgi:hypothetical protein
LSNAFLSLPVPLYLTPNGHHLFMSLFHASNPTDCLILHLFGGCRLHNDTMMANIVPKLDMVYELNVSPR